MENFWTPIIFTATSQEALQHFETESPKEYTMEQVAAKLNDKAEQEIRSHLAQEIQEFRFRFAKGIQFTATCSSPRAARTHSPRGFLSNLLDHLATQAACEMGYGMASPSATVRSLRELLDRLGAGRDHD